MTIGVVGRKYDITHISTEGSVPIPVAVIEVELNRVTQSKTGKTDGYRAVQVVAGERHVSCVTKVQASHFAKANVTAGRGVWEFRLGEEQHAVGDQITIGLF